MYPNNDRLILDLSYEIEFDVLCHPEYFPTPQARQDEVEYLRRTRAFRAQAGFTREQAATAYAIAIARHYAS